MRNLCSWNPESQLLATVSDDNRLKLWDAVEAASGKGSLRQQFAEPAHLKELARYSAIAYGADASNSGAKDQSHLGVVALGASSGALLLWCARTGEVVWRAANAHAGPVSALSFSANGARLFSSGADCKLVEWNARTGELVRKWSAGKNAASALVVSPDNSCLLSASSNIRKWDLSSGKSQKRLTGHAAAVTSLAVSSDGNFLVSGSKDPSDRAAVLWHCQTRRKTVIATLALDSSPVYCEFSRHQPDDLTYHILCVTSNGQVHTFSLNPTELIEQGAGKVKRANSVVTVRTNASDKMNSLILRSGVIFSARFTGPGELLVARKVGIHPVFEKLKYQIDDSFTSSELEPLQSASLIQKSSAPKKRKLTAALTVITATEHALPAPKRARIAATGTESARATDQLLSGRAKQRGGAAGAGQKAPRADSLQEVLVQALQNDDKQLLEYCLDHQKPTIIENTIDRLPTAYVLPFLTKVVERFTARPHRNSLAVWLRVCVERHCAMLANAPALCDSLRALYRAIEARLGVFDRLMRLQGRLELILAQADLKKQQSQDNEAVDGPLNTYVEGEDDENVEVAQPSVSAEKPSEKSQKSSENAEISNEKSKNSEQSAEDSSSSSSEDDSSDSDDSDSEDEKKK
eukprot:135727_1